jgi:hypothetical protein
MPALGKEHAMLGFTSLENDCFLTNQAAIQGVKPLLAK